MSQTKLVFLIEDDADIRDALTQILQMEGYLVKTAENGQEGIDLLRAAHPLPDLILLDLIMPLKDGYEFLRERQHYPRLMRIPVVILTANQTSDNARLIGIHSFLRKPLDMDRLISTMRDAII